MSKHPFIETSKGTATILFKGRDFIVHRSNSSYAEIIKLCQSGDDDKRLLELLEPVRAAVLPVKDFMVEGKTIEVRHGEVLYDGLVLHNAVTRRILDFKHRGLPYEPLVRFLANLMENPSMRAVNELYDFLDRVGLPLTEDGHFLAYKGIRTDMRDKHSGKFDNSPGKILKMRRNAVDDDRTNECSYGFHAGAYSYARNFGEVIVRVKINPKDCVSVPQDHGCQKLRTCQYEVLDVYEQDRTTTRGELGLPLYGTKGEKLTDDEIREKYPTSSPNIEKASPAEILHKEVTKRVIEVLADLTGDSVQEIDLDEAINDDEDEEGSRPYLDSALIAEELSKEFKVEVPPVDGLVDLHTPNEWIAHVIACLNEVVHESLSPEVEIDPVVVEEETPVVLSLPLAVEEDAIDEELNKAASKLFDKYDRGEVMERGVKAKVIRTKEEGRRLGKFEVCILLAKLQLAKRRK